MKKSLTVVTLLAGAAAVHAQTTYIDLGDFQGHSGKGFAISVYMPQNNNAPFSGASVNDYSAYNPAYVGSSVGSQSQTPGTITYGPAANQYNGLPLGGVSDSGSTEGFVGNGNLWSIAIFAAPGVNNTTALAQEESDNAADSGYMGVGQFNANPTSTSTKSQYANYIGYANVDETGADTAGMFTAPGQTKTGNKYIAMPSSFTSGGGATIQFEVWYNSVNGTTPGGYTFANSPYVGVSSIESLDSLSTSSSAGTYLGLADTSLGGPIQSFALQAVPEPSTIALGVMGASAFLFRRFRK